MKFLCPSCKAKYQISDEKVAGRAVRMKCRKCGQEIRVTSADAVASSSAPPPPSGAQNPDAPSPGSESKTPETEGRASSPRAAEKPAKPTGPLKAAPGTTPSPPGARSAARPPPRPGAAPAKPGAKPATISRPQPRPTTAVAEKASAPAHSAPKPPLGRPGVALAAKAPAAGAAEPKAAIAPRTAPNVEAVAETKAEPPKAEPAKAEPPKQEPVKAEPPKAEPAKVEPPKAEPAKVEPPKAAPVDLQDEYGDEEQTRIADTSALAGAFSAAVVGSTTHQVSDPLTMPGDEWFVGINGVPVGPIRLSELRSKAALGAITKESLVWRDGFEEWRPLKNFPELVAIVEESLSSAFASGGPVRPSRPLGELETLSDPFGATVPQPSLSSPTSAVTGAAVVTDDIELAALRAARGTGRAAWLAVVMALIFGISLGFVIFNRKPEEVVRYVEVPVPGQQQNEVPAPAAAAAGDELPAATAEEKEPAKPGNTKGPLATTKTPQTPPKQEQTGTKLGSRLGGLAAPVPGGPGGPSGNSGPSTAGGQLESSQVQAVVQRYTPSVKRSCWQPAIDTRDKDASSSARVMVSIQVSPSGAVQSVTTSGDPRGYRGLANCIAGRVRGWQFPPAGAPTSVNVPFVFVAQ